MSDPHSGLYDLNSFSGFRESPKERFQRRFRGTMPAIEHERQDESLYAVSDLLECFRYFFALSLDSLKITLT